MLRKAKIYFVFLLSVLIPQIASAHEVYVLSSDEIARDKALPPLNIFQAAVQNEHTFLLILFFAVLALVCILGISLSHKIEARVDPLLLRIKPYAGVIAQVTIGSALIASAYFQSLFGPELPLSEVFGATAAPYIAIALYVAGASLLLGVYARAGALIAALLAIAAFFHEGIYLLTYLTYLGEAIFILLFGGRYGIARARWELSGILELAEHRKYLILRLFFGVSLLYAAVNAKLVHGQLALDTVLKYQLTNYFHFQPLFIVLGAFLIESMIALFFIIGFELRFTSLLFLGFLTASLIFFGEAVWPHLILIGTAATMLVHGYDEYTIERRWYLKGKKEPVL